MQKNIQAIQRNEEKREQRNKIQMRKTENSKMVDLNQTISIIILHVNCVKYSN